MGANDAAAKRNALAAATEQLPWQHCKKILFRLNGTPGSPCPAPVDRRCGGRLSPFFTWHCSIGWAFTERGMTALLRRELLNTEASDDTPEFRSAVAGIICHSDVARPTSVAYLASVTTAI